MVPLAVSRRAWLARAATVLTTLGWGVRRVSGQEEDPSESLDVDDAPWNLATPTAGGTQLWGDVRVYHAWHIQKHALTGHHRLLDAHDVRQAWGTFEQCQGRFETLREERDLPAVTGPVVLLLHGLFRTRGSMGTLARYLREQGEFTPLLVGYPSTRGGVREHAEALAGVIQGLDSGDGGVTKIHFVGHSLGNLVIRHYLADCQVPGGSGLDPRLGRIVMLAPPNQRPKRAELWDNSLWQRPFRLVLGQSGQDLSAGWPDLAGRLAIPPCEFGIIAGGCGDGQGWHSALPGDDDGTVAVSETQLPGAADFRVVPARHTFIMRNRLVQEYVNRFLQTGCFEDEEKRQPIPAEVADEPT